MDAISRTPKTAFRSAIKVALAAPLIVLVILTLAFALFSAIPSDPVRSAIGINASEDAVRSMRSELGYDRPLPVRYAAFLANVARLDFGRSLTTGQPVAAELRPALYETLSYVTSALIIAALGSAALVTIAHFGRSSLRRALTWSVRVIASVPSIIISVSLAVFIVATGAFRFTGDIERENFVAAVVALSLYPLCSLTEIGVTETQRAGRLGYIVAARSLGLSELTIFSRYLSRASLVAWLAQLSNMVATLIVGSAVIEIVFSRSGLGQLLVRAVAVNDYPMLQGITITILVLFAIVNLLDRWLLRWMSPRGRR